jgi:hypothetical protein
MVQREHTVVIGLLDRVLQSNKAVAVQPYCALDNIISNYGVLEQHFFQQRRRLELLHACCCWSTQLSIGALL